MFLAYIDLQWLAKTNITANVPIPVHPGELTGSTHTEKYKHEQKFKQYTIFRKADKAGFRLVQTIYNTTYVVDLQDSEGELIGYSIQKLLQHLEDTYIDIDNLEQKINDNEATLNLTYDPNEKPEMYWNHLQQCQMKAADLQEKNTNNRVMRVAITHFRNHADLTDDTIDRKKKPVTDRMWNNFKKHFDKAIRCNKKDRTWAF